MAEDVEIERGGHAPNLAHRRAVRIRDIPRIARAPPAAQGTCALVGVAAGPDHRREDRDGEHHEEGGRDVGELEHGTDADAGSLAEPERRPKGGSILPAECCRKGPTLVRVAPDFEGDTAIADAPEAPPTAA